MRLKTMAALCLTATLIAGWPASAARTGGDSLFAQKPEAAAPRAGYAAALKVASSGAARPMHTFSSMAPRFEKNMGQTDRRVRYFSRGAGYRLFLTGSEILFAPPGSGDDPIRMQLLGGRQRPPIVGLDRQTAKSNYLLGADSSRWRTGVPNYSKVLLREVYPGVDLVYRGGRSSLEYDFVLQPGAKPSVIRIRFKAAKGVRIDGRGDLVVSTNEGHFVQRKPFIYQSRNDVRHRIPGRFVLKRGVVGFEVGRYNQKLPLVIDPVVTYSTYLGGRVRGTGGPGAEDEGRAVTVDPAGNAYVTGKTDSVDFPVQADAAPPHRAVQAQCCDIFVTKIDPQGKLVYSTYLGDPAEGTVEKGSAIAVDPDGNAYVSGAASGSTFPTTANAFPAACTQQSPMLVKLDAHGSGLLYSSCLGGFGAEGTAIALDEARNAYVAGWTSAGVTTKNPHQEDHGGGTDGFVAKFDPSAAAPQDSLIFSTHIGGAGEDWVRGITLDSSNRIYVSGSTDSTQGLSPTPDAFDSELQGQDALIARYTNAGSLDRLSYVGGAGDDIGMGIAVGSDDNVYVNGLTSSDDFPQKHNPPELIRGGHNDAFVLKLRGDLRGAETVLFSAYIGGSGEEFSAFGPSIALDPWDNVYVIGTTTSDDFPTRRVPTSPSTLGYGGGRDAFVVKLDLGERPGLLLYSTYYGGSASENQYGSTGIAVAPDQSALITGSTSSDDLPPGKQARIREELGGVVDAYVAKLGALLPRIDRVEPATGPVAGGTAVTVQGKNLLNAYRATFGDTPATSVTPDLRSPDTKVIVMSPPHAAGSVDVRITTPEGTSDINRPDAVFTYETGLDVPPGEAPFLAAIAPATGPVEGGQEVTISGVRFSGTSQVEFGQSAVPASQFQAISDSSIRLQTPPHPRPEAVSVRVRTSRGLSNAVSYAYNQAAPPPFAGPGQPSGVTTQAGGQPPSGGSTLGQRPLISAPPTGSGPAPGTGTVNVAPLSAPLPQPAPGSAPGQAPTLVSGVASGGADTSGAVPNFGTGLTPRAEEDVVPAPGIFIMVGISAEKDAAACTVLLTGGVFLIACTMRSRRRLMTPEAEPSPAWALAHPL